MRRHALTEVAERERLDKLPRKETGTTPPSAGQARYEPGSWQERNLGGATIGNKGNVPPPQQLGRKQRRAKALEERRVFEAQFTSQRTSCPRCGSFNLRTKSEYVTMEDMVGVHIETRVCDYCGLQGR